MCGCRGRHECGQGGGRKILIEKAGEALVVEGWIGSCKLDGEFGIGCAEECLVGHGGAREQKLWSAKSGERLREGEAFVKEETDGDEPGAGIVLGDAKKIGARGVEDQSWDHAMDGGEAGGEGGSGAGSVGNDVLRGEMAGRGEIKPRRVGVVSKALLTGADCNALTVAAIVKCEDIDAEVMEAGESGDRIDQGAVAVGEKEDGEVGVASAGTRGYPPAGELRRGGFVRAEADEFVRNACDGGRAACGAKRMQDQLPLALIEEEAEGEITADERCKDGESDGFNQPDGIDDLWDWLGRCALVWRLPIGRGIGARHRFFSDFSTLGMLWGNKAGEA